MWNAAGRSRNWDVAGPKNEGQNQALRGKSWVHGTLAFFGAGVAPSTIIFWLSLLLHQPVRCLCHSHVQHEDMASAPFVARSIAEALLEAGAF